MLTMTVTVITVTMTMIVILTVREDCESYQANLQLEALFSVILCNYFINIYVHK